MMWIITTKELDYMVYMTTSIIDLSSQNWTINPLWLESPMTVQQTLLNLGELRSLLETQIISVMYPSLYPTPSCQNHGLPSTPIYHITTWEDLISSIQDQIHWDQVGYITQMMEFTTTSLEQ